MTPEPVQISRYPNRRFYDRQSSKYVSLADIEQLVQQGSTVEIRDSQTGEDLTRVMLTRIIMDRQPEKMQLFPIDMLHFIVRSNNMMAEFLRDYFRASLMYLEYLQRHGSTVARLGAPMHWMKAWMERLSSPAAAATSPAPAPDGAAQAGAPPPTPPAAASLPADHSQPSDNATAAQLARRVEQLEERIRQMEAAETSQPRA